MQRKTNKFLRPKKKDISLSEIILLSFLIWIAIFLLYSSLNRPAEDIVIKDMKIIESTSDVERDQEDSMN